MIRDYSNITLLIDMDDTIENLLEAWTAHLNKKYGTNVLPKDVNTWDISRCFPSIDRKNVYAPLYDNEFWKTVQPKPDAVKYLKMLKELGFNLYICTTSNYETIRCKLEHIISEHFPFISWGQVITTNNKQLINGDILVDDGVHNLIGGSYKKILMSAPHNLDYDTDKNDMVRVNSWAEAYNEIIAASNKILDLKLKEK